MDTHSGWTVRLCVPQELSQSTPMEEGSSACKERRTAAEPELALAAAQKMAVLDGVLLNT